MPVCSPSDSVTQIVEQPLVEDLDAGVIKEARRRQRLRRVGVTGATLAAAGVLLGAFLLASGGGTNTGAVGRSRPPEPLPRLTGRVLTGPTGLLIMAHGNEGPPFILNVDRHTVESVRGLGLPLRRATAQSPLVGSLTRRPAEYWPPSSTHAVRPSSSSHPTVPCGTSRPSRHAPATTPLPRATPTRPGCSRGLSAVPCTLRLTPGTRPAVPVPCGSLAADTTAGVWIATAHEWAIVDPLTGRTRARTDITPPADPAEQVGDQLFALHGDLALESLGRHVVGVSGGQPRTLSLVNLSSGHRRYLVWPSYFGDIINVVPEPHGPLVAVDFGSPAYPGPAQAEDVWMLDTTTGTFTHLPGYPAQVDIKFSDIAWTTDERLVIIAQGGGRTVLGLWKPDRRRCACAPYLPATVTTSSRSPGRPDPARSSGRARLGVRYRTPLAERKNGPSSLVLEDQQKHGQGRLSRLPRSRRHAQLASAGERAATRGQEGGRVASSPDRPR